MSYYKKFDSSLSNSVIHVDFRAQVMGVQLAVYSISAGMVVNGI